MTLCFMCQLGSFSLSSPGLNSAALFIDRYADHLEQLDLAPLLHFAPLQDMLIEKFGTMPEFFSRLGLTLTEYLKQAPSQEMRLFIWTLEEHRDQYATCHTVLDDYFEIMGKRLDPHTFLTRGKVHLKQTFHSVLLTFFFLFPAVLTVSSSFRRSLFSD